MSSHSLLDHIYYNVNFSPPPGASSGNMEYNIQLNSPLLQNPGDFSLAIVRFDLSLADVPYLIFRIQEGLTQANPNLGVYSFTLSYGGNDYTNYSIYDNAYHQLPIPIAPIQNEGLQFVDYYYYIFEIPVMVDYLNRALAQSTIDLLAANPVLAPLSTPYLKYNPETKLIDFYVPRKFETSNIELWFNNATYKLLAGFKIFYSSNFTSQKRNRLIIESGQEYSNGYTQFGLLPVVPPLWYIFKPDSPQIYSWSELQNIVIKTSLLPIRNEFSIVSGSTQLTPEPILTDFSVPSNIDSNVLTISYANQGVYRYIDLLTENPLSQIDISVFWKDKKGILRPMIVYSSDKFSNMKLAFIRDGLVS